MTNADVLEHSVENPTYGQNNGVCHSNAYEGAEQYSIIRRDQYSHPSDTDPNVEPNVEEIYADV